MHGQAQRVAQQHRYLTKTLRPRGADRVGSPAPPARPGVQHPAVDARHRAAPAWCRAAPSRRPTRPSPSGGTQRKRPGAVEGPLRQQVHHLAQPECRDRHPHQPGADRHPPARVERRGEHSAIASPAATHSTAAPAGQQQRDRVPPPSTAGTTAWPAVDEAGQVAGDEQAAVITRTYCTGSGRSSRTPPARPPACPGWRHGRRGGPPGRRPGVGEEDQEHQHADAEQHGDRLAQHRPIIAGRRPSASRSAAAPSPPRPGPVPSATGGRL